MKMLTLQEEYDMKKFPLRSIWTFYKCYNLSICILGLEDDKIRLKNHLWERMLSSILFNNDYKKYSYKLQLFMKKDLAVIMNALRDLAVENKKLGLEEGDYWKKYALAVRSYELGEDESG